MKKSISVATSLILTTVLTVACSSEPDQEFMDQDADHQQICVKPQPNGELERRPDHECSGQDESGSSGGSGCLVCWYFIGRAHGTPPAVGSKLPAYTPGSFTRPSTGTIARPPASGGFGTAKVSVGG